MQTFAALLLTSCFTFCFQIEAKCLHASKEKEAKYLHASKDLEAKYTLGTIYILFMDQIFPLADLFII